ncbi:MAG: carbohydrate-binding domain-containing protein [Ruminococcus sp.]|nr:carbohydrate-binding domain-containing protein [Ruminococcus sp.]
MSGSIDEGQIEINTTEKVKLYFNGVSITNYSGPAIQVTDAKRFILVLMEGTTSYLQDVNKDSVNDGVICSNDTVEIKGKGSLNIVAGNAHGISSDDDVVIENGTINITSVKSGIIANDDITINAGTLYIYGGTNGIKSKGTLNINGGYTVVSGGAKEEKSSIYAVSDFIYTGGYVFTAGNTVTAPTQTAYPLCCRRLQHLTGGRQHRFIAA